MKTASSYSNGPQNYHKWSLTARFMGPIWGPSGADRTQVGPMLAPWTLLSGQDPGGPHVGPMNFVIWASWPERTSPPSFVMIKQSVIGNKTAEGIYHHGHRGCQAKHHWSLFLSFCDISHNFDIKYLEKMNNNSWTRSTECVTVLPLKMRFILKWTHICDCFKGHK